MRACLAVLMIAPGWGLFLGCTDSSGNRDGGTEGPDAAPLFADLEFDPPHGFLDGPVMLALRTTLDHDTIRYTTDGTRPSADNGTDYTGPIAIDGTSFVRAVLVKDGVPITPVRTQTYLFTSQIIRQGDHRPDGDYVFWTTEMDPVIVDDPAYAGIIEASLRSIPTVSIVTADELLFGEAGIHRGNNLMEGSGGRAGDPNHPDWVEEIGASIELIYPDGYPRGPYRGFQVDAGLKVQGGGGRWDNGLYDHKQSFSLRFRSSYGVPSLRYPVFEDAPVHSEGAAEKFDKLILRAGHNKSWGATWDNEKTVYARDLLARVLQIDMSGIGARGTFVHLYLNGLYWGLYDLAERPDDAHAAVYLGGAEEDWYAGKAKGGTVDGDSTRWDEWRTTVSGTTDFQELSRYLAVDEYLDMAILNVYAATGDFPQYYFVNRNVPEGGPIYFFTWDTEDAFGGGSRRSSDTPQTDRLDQCHQFAVMWGATEEFRQRLAARAHRATSAGGALTDDNVRARWLALTSTIEDAMVAESARWGDERISDTGTRYTRDEHWREARDLVTDAIEGRADRLIEQLRAGSKNGIPYYPAVYP
jgi:hypothetical protein